MRQRPYQIPNILESLRQDVESGFISIEQAAEELCAANWMPVIDVNRTKSLLYGKENLS